MKKLLVPFVILATALAADPDLRITRVHSSMLPVVQATNTVNAIKALGINPTQFATADPPASAPALTNVSTVAFSTTGKQYLWNTTTQGWDFFRSRGAQPALGFPVNFTQRTAGMNIGSEWFGPEWLVDGGGAYADPPTTNILTSSPQTFTSGVENWTALGANTAVTNEGRLLITYVDNAYGAQLPLNTTGSTLTENLDGNQFYRVRFEAYAAGGAADAGIYCNNSGIYSSISTSSTTTSGALPATNTVFDMHLRHTVSGGTSVLSAFGMGAGESVSIDNVYVAKIAPADCVAVRTNTLTGDVVVRAGIMRGVGYAGIVARANQLARPTSYLCVVAPQQWESANTGIRLYKVISGTWTSLATLGTANVWLSGTAPVVGLELEIIGTTYNVYLNGTVMATGTVPTELQSNAYHGMISSGGTSRIVSWTMQTPTEAAAQQSSLWWLGGSLSYSNVAPPNHLVANILANQAAYRYLPLIGAQNGYMGYNHITRQKIWESMGYPAPSFIYADLSANHSTSAAECALYEGLIRRLRGAYPNAALWSFAAPSWGTSGGSFSTNIFYYADRIAAHAFPISTAHAIPLCRIDLTEQYDVYSGFYPISDHYTYNDGLHPNTAGAAWRAGQFRSSITDTMLRGVHNHPVLSSVPIINSGADFWEGTATWNWATNAALSGLYAGTWGVETSEWAYEFPGRIVSQWSQTAGSTLTIPWTGRVFVLQYQCTAADQVSYAIDGGTSYNLTDTGNGQFSKACGATGVGTWYASSGAHTTVITIKPAPTAKVRILGWMTM